MLVNRLDGSSHLLNSKKDLEAFLPKLKEDFTTAIVIGQDAMLRVDQAAAKADAVASKLMNDFTKYSYFSRTATGGYVGDHEDSLSRATHMLELAGTSKEIANIRKNVSVFATKAGFDDELTDINETYKEKYSRAFIQEPSAKGALQLAEFSTGANFIAVAGTLSALGYSYITNDYMPVLTIGGTLAGTSLAIKGAEKLVSRISKTESRLPPPPPALTDRTVSGIANAASYVATGTFNGITGAGSYVASKAYNGITGAGSHIAGAASSATRSILNLKAI